MSRLRLKAAAHGSTMFSTPGAPNRQACASNERHSAALAMVAQVIHAVDASLSDVEA